MARTLYHHFDYRREFVLQAEQLFDPFISVYERTVRSVSCIVSHHVLSSRILDHPCCRMLLIHVQRDFTLPSSLVCISSREMDTRLFLRDVLEIDILEFNLLYRGKKFGRYDIMERLEGHKIQLNREIYHNQLVYREHPIVTFV